LANWLGLRVAFRSAAVTPCDYPLLREFPCIRQLRQEQGIGGEHPVAGLEGAQRGPAAVAEHGRVVRDTRAPISAASSVEVAVGDGWDLQQRYGGRLREDGGPERATADDGSALFTG